VHGIGDSQHQDKAPHIHEGLKDGWRSHNGIVTENGRNWKNPSVVSTKQAFIHFLHGPTDKWDAWDQDSTINMKAAKSLKKFVDDLRTFRANRGRCQEPIFIYAYSNGTTVTTFALEMGMQVDGVVFAGGSLENDHDMTKALKNTPFLRNCYSSEDGTNVLVDGIGRKGFANKFKGLREQHVPRVDHYADDATARSRDRVVIDGTGWTEWDSRYMAKEHYSGALQSKQNCLSDQLHSFLGV
jgi:hypothetical protein